MYFNSNAALFTLSTCSLVNTLNRQNTRNAHLEITKGKYPELVTPASLSRLYTGQLLSL